MSQGWPEESFKVINRPLILLLAACGTSDDATTTLPRNTPVLVATSQVCKLLSNANTSDPTANDVQHRANVRGADLGIPVEHQGALYLLFGDTIGFAGIWGNGESHPDAIGRVADASQLCGGIEILTLPPESSVGPTVDPTVAADFAGAAMTAPAGHEIGEFIRNPPPGFPFLPGDFEVPSGAFSEGGALYAFYTTVGGPGDVEMKGSYLARTTEPPAYDILYAVDERFDDAGPLGGHFINVAAEVAGDTLYLFGTGAYRQSGIYLASKPLADIASPGGFTAAPAPIVETPGYGETSARYLAAVDRWLLLAEEITPTTNRIVARFADRPEGPWSDAIVVHDMDDPTFRARYCCVPEDACQGEQFFNCSRTGFYGSYLLPSVEVAGDGFTVTYTLSSFDPYNVAVFSATFR